MNIFQLLISALVFGSTLLLGTTAVIASRFVITTVAGLTKPAEVSESVVVPAAGPERVVDLPDLRNELPPIPDDFNATGSYSLDIERVPPAFADIEFLEIETREYDEQNETYLNRQIIPIGALQAKKTFTFTKLAVSNREISFETDTQNGIRYQFVGNFPVLTEFIACEECEYPADLSGRLKKLKNGKVIAELDAKFYYNGC